MASFSDIIDRWPSLQDFASDIGVKYGTAQVMRYRNSISPRRWNAVVSAAHQRGMADVTLSSLAQLAEARGPRIQDQVGAHNRAA